MSCKSQSLQTGLLQKPLIPIAHLYHAPTHTTLYVALVFWIEIH